MMDFCTYFDSNYAARGIALCLSLRKVCKAPFRLHVACLDEPAYEILSSLGFQELCLVKLEAIEKADPAFARCKDNRSKVEYYFTLSPVLPLLILSWNPGIESVCYLDSDLLFYSDPQALFNELGGASILVTEHRFPPHLKEKERFGRFNVQCQIFRNDSAGRACLEWWRERCIEWCFDRLEGDRFADQKYLERWPELFGSSLVVSKLKGAGLAPWNWSNYDLRVKDGEMTVDGEPLVFYHFQGFKIVNRFLINHGLGYYGKPMPKEPLRWLYLNYASELLKSQGLIASVAPGLQPPPATRSSRTSRSLFSRLGNLLSSQWRNSVIFTWGLGR